MTELDDICSHRYYAWSIPIIFYMDGVHEDITGIGHGG